MAEAQGLMLDGSKEQQLLIPRLHGDLVVSALLRLIGKLGEHRVGAGYPGVRH